VSFKQWSDKQNPSIRIQRKKKWRKNENQIHYKDWTQQQENIQRFATMLIEAFSHETNEQISDIEYVLNVFIKKYGEESTKWVYALSPLERDKAWKRYYQYIRQTRFTEYK